MQRPKLLDEVVGQDQVKQRLQILIKAANVKNKVIPHILFFGSSGVGKTTLANIIANELKATLFPINGASITNPLSDLRDIIDLIKQNKERVILFIDEIHAIDVKTAEWFYTILEDFEYYNWRGQKVKLPPFTIVGATTRLGKLPQPMRDRFPHIIELQDYNIDQMKDIIIYTANKSEFDINEASAIALAKTCRGIPRLAVNRTEFIKDYIIATNDIITPDKIVEILKIQGIDPQGLTEIDRKYIKFISENGPVSLSQLSSLMNLEKGTLESSIEPYLIREGLIRITRQGRETTSPYQPLGDLI